MGVDLNTILAIIGAMGGGEGIKWAIRAWVNRATDARKEDAAADAMEIDNEKTQVSWLEERITQRDLKIDALYVELRQEQSAKLEEVHRRYQVELALKDAEHNRCDMSDGDCSRRIPPRRKIIIDKKDENEKE